MDSDLWRPVTHPGKRKLQSPIFYLSPGTHLGHLHLLPGLPLLLLVQWFSKVSFSFWDCCERLTTSDIVLYNSHHRQKLGSNPWCLDFTGHYFDMSYLFSLSPDRHKILNSSAQLGWNPIGHHWKEHVPCHWVSSAHTKGHHSLNVTVAMDQHRLSNPMATTLFLTFIIFIMTTIKSPSNTQRWI